MMRGLFSLSDDEEEVNRKPLAARMRPTTLKEVVGQEHILGKGQVLNRLISRKKPTSLILWGPPGSGKTTLANVMASVFDLDFVTLSAVNSGVKAVRKVIERAQETFRIKGKKTVLFIDEVHRFNKAQQDAFLPHIEKGEIIFIGATTENPSFEIISPLLSRTRVFTLHPLEKEHIKKILIKAIKDENKGLGKLPIDLTDEAIDFLTLFSNGDARIALNTLELVVSLYQQDDVKEFIRIEKKHIQNTLKKSAYYDKSGEAHYNFISALHKSIRGGDVNASLYWLGRMLEGGEDPKYIVRRLIRIASEDIGNAVPQALTVCIAAKEAVEFLGLPECDTALAQAVIFLASAPKSNAVYQAWLDLKKDLKKEKAWPVPLYLRNAPTSMMKKMGYGREYIYPPHTEHGIAKQKYFPEEMEEKSYYKPLSKGFEKKIKKYMIKWEKIRNQ